MSKLKTENRKKEIIDASLSIIFEEGYVNLTMRKIANRIGISEAALYKHFSSKQQVVESMIDYYFTERLFNENIDPHGDFVSTLHGLFKHKFYWLEENPKLSAVIFQGELFREFPPIKERFIENRRKLEKQLAEFIMLNQSKEIVIPQIDPNIYAVIIISSVRFSILRWNEENFSYSLVQEGDKLAGEFIRSMLKSE